MTIIFRQELSGVCCTKVQHMISLMTELDPLHGEEASGHVPTFELSQGRNADLANDCHVDGQ